MFNALKKYNFITVLPFEDTYLYVTTLPQKIKLSKELISINYLKHSPYQNPHIVSLIEQKQLSLWFYKHNKQENIVIPESYLAYKELNKNNEDALYITEDSPHKLIIIKNSTLLDAFTLEDIDQTTINLTLNEHNLTKTTKISKQQYKNILEISQKNISLKEIYSFSQLDFDQKDIFQNILNATAYPISALVVFAMLVSYTQGAFLSSQVQKLTKTYKTEKSKNKEIKSYINQHNKTVKRYKTFIDKELLYTGPIILLHSIYDIFKDGDKAYIGSIAIHANSMKLQLKTDENPIKYLNRLSQIKYFKQVIIQSTRKPTRGIKTITYTMEIKLLKDA